jgi:hypothetical protein
MRLAKLRHPGSAGSCQAHKNDSRKLWQELLFQILKVQRLRNASSLGEEEMPLNEPRLILEDKELLFFDDWEGDSLNNSAVWVPSIKIVCATDVAFHDCHLWPIESTVARRVKWRASINKLREFNARIVIPGHCDNEKIQIMEEAQTDSARSYTECIDWSLKYLDNYKEVYHTARTAMDMVSAMTKFYPDVKAEDFAIHWQARLLFPQSSPAWLTPLPGKPGKIF